MIKARVVQISFYRNRNGLTREGKKHEREKKLEPFWNYYLPALLNLLKLLDLQYIWTCSAYTRRSYKFPNIDLYTFSFTFPRVLFSTSFSPPLAGLSLIACHRKKWNENRSWGINRFNCLPHLMFLTAGKVKTKLRNSLSRRR